MRFLRFSEDWLVNALIVVVFFVLVFSLILNVMSVLIVKKFPVYGYDELSVSRGSLGLSIVQGVNYKDKIFIDNNEGREIFYCRSLSGSDGSECKAYNLRTLENKSATVRWFYFCGKKYLMELKVSGSVVLTYDKYLEIYEKSIKRGFCF